jgi:hypothetical protein
MVSALMPPLYDAPSSPPSGTAAVPGGGFAAVGDTGEHVGGPSQRIDVIELCRYDQRGHGRGPVGTAFRAGEEPGFAPQGHLPFILPMSGMKLKSIIAGIRSMVGVFDANTVSSAPTAGLFTSRRHRVGGVDAGSCRVRRHGDRRATR